MLRVRLYGELALEVDGRAVELPRSRRARALLAWLALHPGTHARRELAGRFWPDVLDDSARTSLRTGLTELRKALGPAASALVATRELVGLAGEELWVDAREVERLLDSGRVQEAVELGGEQLLRGFDDEWVLEARRTHVSRLGDALETLARQADAAGDVAAAVRHSRAAAALDPLAEEPHRRLMRRLADGGDRAAALRVYEALADRLRTALAITPSPPTRALAAEIRGPVAQRPALSAPAALERDAETPFVGRAAELDRLRACWAGVTMHAARRCIVLSGEPGIGKTRLAVHFAGERHQTGAAVLAGRCSREPARPYEPFAEMLAHAAGALDGESLLDVLAPSAGPAIDRLLGAAPEPAGEDAGAQHRLFDAVDAALVSLAAGRPLLLLVDDLQWADGPTLRLLVALMRQPRRMPLLVVATAREAEPAPGDPVAAALEDLRRGGAMDRLAVAGLAETDVAGLVREWLGNEAQGQVARTVYARTAGNPFFAEELLRAVRDDEPDGVPRSVRQAIAARLGGVGPEAEVLLATAAVLGLDVPTTVLQRASGLAVEAAERALDELLAAHVLRPAPGRPDAVEFSHALVREAVDAGLNPLRRARLHARAADALAEAGEEAYLERIANHMFHAGGDVDRAIAYLRRAGQRATAMLAHEAAAGHLGRALDVLARSAPAEDARRGALMLERGQALLRAGDPVSAAACFDDAAALARRNRDPRLLAQAALGRCGLGVAIIGVEPERVAALEEALEALGDTEPALRSELTARLAVELYYAPARDRSEGLSARAVALASETRDPRALASALNARHVALWRPDRLDERLRTAAEMLAVARAAGDRHLELQALNWRVLDLWEAGDLPAWRVEVRRHGALADELRLPAYAWYTPLWAAVDALHAGRFEEGRRLLYGALWAGERAGDPNAGLFARMLEFQDALMSGEHERVDLVYAREKIVSSPAGMSWRCGYAWFMAETGDLDAAREHLEIAAADDFAGLPFDMNWPSAMTECAEACVRLGDARLAAALYDRLRPYAGRSLTAGRAIATYGVADRQLAGLALVLGRHEEAVERYRRAVELDTAAGLIPWARRAQAGLDRARAVAAGSAPVRLHVAADRPTPEGESPNAASTRQT